MSESFKSRLEVNLSRDKGRIQDFYDFLREKLLMYHTATVKEYDEKARKVICTLDRDIHKGVEITAPLLHAFINPQLKKGQKVILGQSSTDINIENSRNFFDIGNWVVISVKDPKGYIIDKIPKLSIINEALGIETGNLSLESKNPIVFKSSQVSLKETLDSFVDQIKNLQVLTAQGLAPVSPLSQAQLNMFKLEIAKVLK